MADDIEAIFVEARAARQAGRPDEALACYERAAALARSSEDRAALAHALRHVSELAREHGADALALEAGSEAVALVRGQSGTPLDLANALRVQALATEAVQGPEAAAALWREARGQYQAMQVDGGVRECDRRLADVKSGD